MASTVGSAAATARATPQTQVYGRRAGGDQPGCRLLDVFPAVSRQGHPHGAGDP